MEIIVIVHHQQNRLVVLSKNNKLEFVEEEKLEFVCDIDKVKTVISKLREVHPYEEPAIDIVPLIDENYFE